MPTGIPQVPHVSVRHFGHRFGPMRSQKYPTKTRTIGATTHNKPAVFSIVNVPCLELGPLSMAFWWTRRRIGHHRHCGQTTADSATGFCECLRGPQKELRGLSRSARRLLTRAGLSDLSIEPRGSEGQARTLSHFELHVSCPCFSTSLQDKGGQAAHGTRQP